MGMSVKERALRFALDFFKNESRWEHRSADGRGLEGSLCLGLALLKGRAVACHRRVGTWSWDPAWLDETMQLEVDGCRRDVADWNDYVCPHISVLRSQLKCRIAHYEQERLAQTPIAVIILGPGRNVRRL